MDPTIAAFEHFVKETEPDIEIRKKTISLFKKFNKKIYYKSNLFYNELIDFICTVFSKDKNKESFLNNIEDGENVLKEVVKYIEPRFTFDIDKFLPKLRNSLIKQKIVKKQIINWYTFFEYTRIILDDYLYRINTEVTLELIEDCHNDIRLALYMFICETAIEILNLLSPLSRELYYSSDDIIDIILPLISSCTKTNSNL